MPKRTSPPSSQGGSFSLPWNTHFSSCTSMRFPAKPCRQRRPLSPLRGQLPFQENPGRDESASPEREGDCEAGGGVHGRRIGGSKRRQRRPVIRKESCGFADLGRSNLWRPTVVDRTRGSQCVQAQPAGSKWLSALPTRATPGNQSARNLADSQKSTAPIYGG